MILQGTFTVCQRSEPGLCNEAPSQHGFTIVLMSFVYCRLAIVGGGYIAAEQACIYNNFGTEVSMYYRGKHILAGRLLCLYYCISMQCQVSLHAFCAMLKSVAMQIWLSAHDSRGSMRACTVLYHHSTGVKMYSAS